MREFAAQHSCHEGEAERAAAGLKGPGCVNSGSGTRGEGCFFALVGGGGGRSGSREHIQADATRVPLIDKREQLLRVRRGIGVVLPGGIVHCRGLMGRPSK